MKVEKDYNVIHDNLPEELEVKKLGRNIYELTLNENIETIEIENEDGTVEEKYTSDRANAIDKFDNLDEIKGALVQLKYSQFKENGLTNKGIVEPENEEYLEYRAYVEKCKAYVNGAKAVLQN